MKNKHIILRVTGGTSRGTSRGPGAAAGPLGGATGMKVEVDTLDSADISKVTRNRDVVAVAPSIPMRLIKPVRAKSGRKAKPMAAGVDWGIEAVGATSSAFTGDGVVVAVLDTGIDPTHKAFAGVTLVRRNFTEESDDDEHGHGTHCAGTIFGRDVDGMRIGVARGVKKALIGKVLGRERRRQRSDRQRHPVGGGRGGQRHLDVARDGLPRVPEAADGANSGSRPELATSRALEGYRQNVLLFERWREWSSPWAAFGKPTIIVAAAGNESQHRRQSGLQDRGEPAGRVRRHHLGRRARPAARTDSWWRRSPTPARWSPGPAWRSPRPSAAAG